MFITKKFYLMLMALALICVVAVPSPSFAGGGSNCVTLYSKANGKGNHKRVCGDRKDLSKIGWDNKTQSIKVEDITVYLYKDKNYKKLYGSAEPHTVYNLEHKAGISSLKFNTKEV